MCGFKGRHRVVPIDAIDRTILSELQVNSPRELADIADGVVVSDNPLRSWMEDERVTVGVGETKDDMT